MVAGTGRAIGGASGGTPFRGWLYGVIASPQLPIFPYLWTGSSLRRVTLCVSYYVLPTVVAKPSFFGALHQVGFWNRAAMLDHIAGTHKFLLATAAYICPDEAESCLFPAY